MYAPGGASLIALIGLILVIVYIKKFAKSKYPTGKQYIIATNVFSFFVKEREIEERDLRY